MAKKKSAAAPLVKPGPAKKTATPRAPKASRPTVLGFKVNEKVNGVTCAINRSTLVREIAAAEGKKVAVDIAQISEVTRLVLLKLSRYKQYRVLELLDKVHEEHIADILAGKVT